MNNEEKHRSPLKMVPRDDVDLSGIQAAALGKAQRIAQDTQIDDMRSTRDHRVRMTLLGDPSFTLANTYHDFISLLRSGDVLDQSLRDAIAYALERGQIDQKGGVRLKIESDGDWFKRIDNIDRLEKSLEAGLFMARQRHKGTSQIDVLQGLADRFGKADVIDYAKRSKTVYRSFLTWLEENHGVVDIFDWRTKNDIRSFERSDDFEEDDYFFEARSVYIMKTSPLFMDRYEGGNDND